MLIAWMRGVADGGPSDETEIVGGGWRYVVSRGKAENRGLRITSRFQTSPISRKCL
jgi:hypothetical protein